MTTPMPFELQGHRGARGLKPENTLPSFEAALDAGVSTIETDVHLTRDGEPVLCHDPVLSEAIASLLPGEAEPASRAISQLTLDELRRFIVAGNPDRQRFPYQNNDETPLAQSFGIFNFNPVPPFAVPTLADLFCFVEWCAEGGFGIAKHNLKQQECARKVRFDLELKRVPFEPQTIGDSFDGAIPGKLERRVLEEARRAGVLKRCTVRSFDHRSLRAARKQEPYVTTAVLIAETRPVSPETLAHAAGATVYCPDYRFVDEAQIGALHDAGLRVIPWTVNRPEDWTRLVAWGVDGLTTDFPDQLAEWLAERGIAVL